MAVGVRIGGDFNSKYADGAGAAIYNHSKSEAVSEPLSDDARDGVAHTARQKAGDEAHGMLRKIRAVLCMCGGAACCASEEQGGEFLH
jgi:hypothetical protein